MKIEAFCHRTFLCQIRIHHPLPICNSDCETVTVEELLAMTDMSLEEFGRLSLGYTESPGNPQMREEIAAAYQGVTAEDVLILGTPIEGIYLAARASLNPAMR